MESAAPEAVDFALGRVDDRESGGAFVSGVRLACGLKGDAVELVGVECDIEGSGALRRWRSSGQATSVVRENWAKQHPTTSATSLALQAIEGCGADGGIYRSTATPTEDGGLKVTIKATRGGGRMLEVLVATLAPCGDAACVARVLDGAASRLRSTRLENAELRTRVAACVELFNDTSL